MDTIETEDESLSDALSNAYESIESGESAAEPETLEFEQNEAAELPEPSAEGDDVVAKEAEPEAPAEPAEPKPEDAAPSSWKRDVASKWGDLPPEARAEIHRRESDYHKSISEYKQYAGIGHEVEKAITPYLQNIQAAGVAPIEAMQKLFEADNILRNSTPEQKGQYFAQLAQEYGIDLTQVQPQAPIDPAVLELRKQNQELQRYQQSVESQRNQAAQAEIERFKNDPANVHFEVVWEDMALLLQNGKAENLQDAYDKAVWMRPDIRKSLVEQQRTEAEQQAAAALRDKRAQSAAVGIKGAAATKVSSLSPTASLRETIAAAMTGDV